MKKLFSYGIAKHTYIHTYTKDMDPTDHYVRLQVLETHVGRLSKKNQANKQNKTNVCCSKAYFSSVFLWACCP